MDYHCIESTIDVQCPNGLTVRLWLDEDAIPIVEGSTALLKIARVIQDASIGITRTELLTEVSRMENVNAVQVMDTNFDINGVKMGCVVYTVGFEGDVHG